MAAPMIYDRFGIELRVSQQKAIDAIQNGKDVFLGTRTGSGKSLVYESYPVINKGKIVLVVAPLITIMNEQCRRLCKLGFKATYIGKDTADSEDILAGNYDFVFGSAEHLVENTVWRAMLTSDPYQTKLGLVVVDEAHTVIHWGKGREKEEPFRESFSRIGELRSLCDKAQMLALTATAGPTDRREIMKVLCFKPTSEVILDSPDRHNIKITAVRIPNNDDLFTVFKFMIDDFKIQKEAFPRHVIFCESIANVSKVYFTFLKHMGQSQDLFEMYHSKTNDKIKEKIRKDMSENGKIRILICTNSAGMGVNFENVHNVVHYGLPREMDTFVQQMGRAGRDGQYSKEVVLYKVHKGHLSKVEIDLVKLVKDDSTCRHKTLCESYMAVYEPIIPKHKCCDICEKQCDCGEDLCPDIHAALEVHDDKETEPVEMERSITADEKALLRHKLSAFKYSLESDLSNVLIKSEILHGFTDNVIDEIVLNCSKIFTTSDILNHFPIWSFEIAEQIMKQINIVTGDTDMYDILSDNDENFDEGSN